MWFDILKVQESITDLGLDFESPDEKLEPKDNEDKCCEKYRPEIVEIIGGLIIAKDVAKMDCADLYGWTEDFVFNRPVNTMTIDYHNRVELMGVLHEWEKCDPNVNKRWGNPDWFDE
jgi:hypothetical protein